MNVVIVTSPMVVTVAIRSPATITGSAIGSSTRQNRWPVLNPMPSAASMTSGDTPSRATTMLRIRISSV